MRSPEEVCPLDSGQSVSKSESSYAHVADYTSAHNNTRAPSFRARQLCNTDPNIIPPQHVDRCGIRTMDLLVAPWGLNVRTDTGKHCDL